ncbi:hypothetical protein CSOJ01_03051 [Colletotrichum sojae]|uniref:Cell wall protein n=1 Tax=Colletotrichum sojae TaxID=2175907 RepID=A0A8H6JNL1_9PEZI|nr:hypothetical protein CSOJ01_03051 [Colletotrichum sojae]
MHFITKTLHVCAVLHVAFRGASGAILRGRSDADPVYLPSGKAGLSAQTAALTDDLAALDKHLSDLLGIWDPDDADPVSSIAKRQDDSVRISRQALQELLRLIQSIEVQVAALLPPDDGGSPSGSTGPGQPPPGPTSGPGPVTPPGSAASPPPVSSPVPTASPPGSLASSPGQSPGSPAASSPPSNPSIVTRDDPDNGPPVPTPFLTSSVVGNPNPSPATTVYGTATSTTRCKTTLTQTFTSYVYEDGSPAVVPREVSFEEEVDGLEDSEIDDASEQDGDGLIEVGPWGEPDGTTGADDDVEFGQSVTEPWTTLTTRRESRRSPDRSKLLFIHEDEDALEMAAM